jgi:hypothetical protein
VRMRLTANMTSHVKTAMHTISINKRFMLPPGNPWILCY